MPMTNRIGACCAALLVVQGCIPSPSEPSSSSHPEVTVTAAGETEPVGTANEDAADDPAIWHNPEDPAASLILGTDKKAGLHVYDLDGKSLHFEPGGRLNNVDLVDLGASGVIVAASDRNDPADAAIRLYRLDTVAATLEPLGSVDGGTGEAYGLCLFVSGNALHAVSVLKEGVIEEYRLEGLAPGETPRSERVLTRKVASQPEGCVGDPRDGTLYVGEEMRGIWRYSKGSAKGTLVAEADGKHLVADVEGLAILPEGKEGGWLVASSQGDNAFALYRLPEVSPAGRFRIGKGAFGATEETDGIALDGRDFGASYPDGLFVAQDGVNAPSAQNFKLVSWRAIMEAMDK
jgi:3-phytase